MNSLRRVVGLLMTAVMLAAFALPAAAQTQKLQTISMPTTIGFNRTVTVTWNNSSPPGGNSQISSTKIAIGADGVNAGWTFASAVSSTGTVAVSPTLITIQKVGPIKPQKSFTVTFTLTAAGMDCGESSSFVFTAYTGSQLSGDNFFDQGNQTQPYSVKSATYSCESLACLGTFSDDFLSGVRLNNKDGSTCSPANVFTSVNAADRQVSVVSDNPVALFEATVAWPPEFVDSATGMPKTTQVSWQLDSGGNPINIVDGRACIGDVPMSLGTVVSFLDQTHLVTSAAVSFPTTPTPTNPIPVVVDSERMNVTGTDSSGTTLTVVRGAGNTTPISHTLPKPLMTTPFPLDGSGTVMLVCIVTETFETVSADQCSPITPAKACVTVTTTVLGDFYVGR